jgi:hypothetical protein
VVAVGHINHLEENIQRWACKTFLMVVDHYFDISLEDKRAGMMVNSINLVVEVDADTESSNWDTENSVFDE